MGALLFLRRKPFFLLFRPVFTSCFITWSLNEQTSGKKVADRPSPAFQRARADPLTRGRGVGGGGAGSIALYRGGGAASCSRAVTLGHILCSKENISWETMQHRIGKF